MQERYQFEQRSKELSQVNQHLTSKNTVLQEQLNGFKQAMQEAIQREREVANQNATAAITSLK